MADTNETSPTSHRRRSSFAGQTFADIFGAGRGRAAGNTGTNSSSNPSASPTSQFPGPLSSVAAQAQRRMSIHQLGIPASPNPRRRDSISSANSTSIDESAIEDEYGPNQQTPFGRRVSFGAKALKDVKTSGQGNGGTDRLHGRSSIAETGVPAPRTSVDGGKKTTPPQAKGRGLSSSFPGPVHRCDDYSVSCSNSSLTTCLTGEGYNWADSFRNRAERSASISSIGASSPTTHVRAQSVATMEPPVQAPQPPPPARRVPDHFQERILKGDFYMD